MSGVCAQVEGWTENRGGDTKGDGGELNGRTVWGRGQPAQSIAARHRCQACDSNLLRERLHQGGIARRHLREA